MSRLKGGKRLLAVFYRALRPRPLAEIDAMTPEDIAILLGWDLMPDVPEIVIGEVEEDVATRPAGAPAKKKLRRVG